MQRKYNTRNFTRRYIFPIASLLFSALIFISIEASLRAIQYSKTHDKRWLDYGFRKNISFKFDVDNFHSYHKLDSNENNINSYGFRGKEFSVKKIPGRFRIVVVGGSSTYGAFNDEDHTYPGILEQMLNRDLSGEYEVINAGIPALSTDNLYELIRKEVIPINPDMIILNSFYNHFASTHPPVGILQKVLYLLEQKSVLFLKLKEKLYAALNRGYIGANNYGYYLERIVRLAKAEGIDLVLIRQPMLLSKNDGIAIDRPQWYGANLQILDSIGRKYNLIIADGAKLSSSDKSDIFHDVVHLTDKGNALLAEIIFNSLKDKYFKGER